MRAIMLHVTSASLFRRWMNLRIVLITIAAIAFFVSLAKATTVEPSYLFGEKTGNSLIINLDAVEVSEYEITINGEIYTGDILLIEQKAIQVFNFTALRNTAFFIHEFQINGKDCTGKFDSIQAFVDCINAKTDSQWHWDEARGIIFGGNDNTSCSNIVVTTADDLGEMVELPASTVNIAKRIQIVLPSGNNTVTLNNFVKGFKAKKEFYDSIASND